MDESYRKILSYPPHARIKALMERRGMSIKDLVKETGLSKTIVYYLVKGERKITPRIAFKLGEVFPNPSFEGKDWVKIQALYDYARYFFGEERKKDE